MQVTERTTRWDKRFLRLAFEISTWSKDPSTKVGAVITDADMRIVSTGFNGLPRGIKDLPDRLQDRESKYSMIVHGDMNAVLFARRDLTGCTIYTVPFMPCDRCAAVIAQTGISRVVAPLHDATHRWIDSIRKAELIFTEAQVPVVFYQQDEIKVLI